MSGYSVDAVMALLMIGLSISVYVSAIFVAEYFSRTGHGILASVTSLVAFAFIFRTFQVYLHQALKLFS